MSPGLSSVPWESWRTGIILLVLYTSEDLVLSLSKWKSTLGRFGIKENKLEWSWGLWLKQEEVGGGEWGGEGKREGIGEKRRQRRRRISLKIHRNQSRLRTNLIKSHQTSLSLTAINKLYSQLQECDWLSLNQVSSWINQLCSEGSVTSWSSWGWEPTSVVRWRKASQRRALRTSQPPYYEKAQATSKPQHNP